MRHTFSQPVTPARRPQPRALAANLRAPDYLETVCFGLALAATAALLPLVIILRG